MQLFVLYKGKRVDVTVPKNATGADLFRGLKEATNSPDTIFKCIYKGKQIKTDTSLASLKIKNRSKKISAIGTNGAAANAEATRKLDPTIKSLKQEEEENKKRQRATIRAHATVWGGDQHPTYRFARFGTCKRFEGQVPHPFAAREMLRTLASDPGVVKVMKAYQLVVGKLEEMDPDDRLAAVEEKKRGGCLLGYNQNGGQVIFLRLRRTDAPAFRPYTDLIDTLLHELSHNISGPHNLIFWRTFGRLKAEYLQTHLHRRRHPMSYPRTKTSKASHIPTVESPIDSADCEQIVLHKLRKEVGSNGALKPQERAAAALAAQEVMSLVQIARQKIASAPPPAQPSQAEKDQTRQKISEATMRRLDRLSRPKSNQSKPDKTDKTNLP